MFDFGENWLAYSQRVLTQRHLQQAIKDIDALVGRENIKGKSFWSIGCGSGIHSLAVAKLGAKRIVATDISPKSIEASKLNQQRFLPSPQVEFQVDDILNTQIKKHFDVVYSWGVFHHTGQMHLAIERACRHVKPRGLLVLAIYNRHWSSPIWWRIKQLYNLTPDWVKRLMVVMCILPIAIAKFLVTGKNPFIKKRRGMTFYYDVIDWVGGFPYEYASRQEIVELVTPQGFKLEKFVPAQVPTGCHEYVFRKI